MIASRRMIASRMMCAFLVALPLVAVAQPLGEQGPPLVQSAKNGDRARVRMLLAKGDDVNRTGPDGTTALHWAARRDDAEMAALLIGAAANVSVANRYGVTPLTLACSTGSPTMLGLLLEAGADPNATSPLGETPLMLASRTGTLASVQALLGAGAAVNVAGPSKQTALMWAAAEGHAAVVQALLAAGAQVDARSDGGFTPLLFAVRGGHSDVVRKLVAAGANVNERKRTAAASGPPLRSQASDEDGSTSALVLAIINAHYDVAALLLEVGADPNVPDARGSALHAIAWMRKPGMTLSLTLPPKPKGEVDALDLAKTLLTRGANPNVRLAWKEIRFDRDDGETRTPPNIRVGRGYLTLVGATPFFLAARHGDVALMRLLAAHGADPQTSTVQNVTPLMAAAGLGFWDGETPGPITGTPERERLEALKLAWELGGDVNARTDFGDFPIVGDSEELLHQYANNLEDLPEAALGDVRWHGSTALHGAAVADQPSLVEFLVEKGAKLDARNKVGWTPLMVAQGMFVAAHGGKRRAASEEALVRLMRERGMDPALFGQKRLAASLTSTSVR